MLDLLLVGELDIVVGSSMIETRNDGLVIEPLLDEQIGVFVRASGAGKQSAPAKMSSLLQQEHWVFPDAGTHLRTYIEGELKQRGISMPGRLIESRSTSAIRWFAQNTDCFAFSTTLVHMPELLSGEVVMLDTDWQFRTTKHVLYRRALHTMSRSARAFVDAIKAEAKKHKVP